jgi:hypothetical protein
LHIPPGTPLYRIAYKCGREYIGEMSRKLDVRINKHKYNISKDIFDRYNLLHICLKDISVSGIRQLFYSSNSIVFIENRKEQLICYVGINLSASPVYIYIAHVPASNKIKLKILWNMR